MSSHRSVSADGVKLLIIDGDFFEIEPLNNNSGTSYFSVLRLGVVRA